MNGAAAGTATTYKGTFHGRAEEAGRVRREVAGYLGDCPVTDDVVLIADELAANALLHSQSRGEFFTVRCEVFPGYVRVEVEDLGGPWRTRREDGRPHGLDVVQALAGADRWAWTGMPPGAWCGHGWTCPAGAGSEHRTRGPGSTPDELNAAIRADWLRRESPEGSGG